MKVITRLRKKRAEKSDLIKQNNRLQWELEYAKKNLSYVSSLNDSIVAEMQRNEIMFKRQLTADVYTKPGRHEETTRDAALMSFATAIIGRQQRYLNDDFHKSKIIEDAAKLTDLYMEEISRDKE